MNYEKQARDFLEKTNTLLHVTYLTTRKHFPDDTEERDVYSVSIVRGNKSHTLEFGDSIVNTHKNANAMARKRPSAYDILACLQKYEPERDIDDFASEYEIEKPSEAIRIYGAVSREYAALADMYTPEELSELAEIV